MVRSLIVHVQICRLVDRVHRSRLQFNPLGRVQLKPLLLSVRDVVLCNQVVV